MRDFFIRGFEIILGAVLVIAAVAIVAVAGFVAFGEGGMPGMPGAPGGAPGMQGPLAGVAILLGGLVALLVYGGIAYLGLGIYHNTRRTAELLAARGGRI